MASKKNEVNIMVKNVVDVVFGGLTYWMVGYGLTFGDSPGSNGFTGMGSFFLNPSMLLKLSLHLYTITLLNKMAVHLSIELVLDCIYCIYECNINYRQTE